MLKTNSKQVKEKIDAYILASFRDYAQREAEGRDIKEVKDYIARCVLGEKLGFKGDHWHSMEKQGFKSLEAVFFDWCQGLPSVLDCDYYYNVCAVDLVGDILEQTEEERNRYTEPKAEKLMTSLLYRALDPFIFRHFCQAIDLEKLNRGE